MDEFGEAITAGAWLVDMIPWLQYIPEWVPGAGFKKIARNYKKTYEDTLNIPFNFAKQEMESGRRPEKSSYIARLLETNPNAEQIELIKNTAATLYAGGADTTVAQLGWFFVAMSLFPEVQIKAKEELDRVIGHRLPTFQDRVNLPYIEGVFKEALRWNPIAPLCVPHTSDEEEEFRGYRIPKGAAVVPSVAWFGRDPAVYSEPHLYKPERHLSSKANSCASGIPDNTNERDPNTFAFGFGRRVCPGRRLADAGVWLTIAQALAVFEIKKPVDPKSGIEMNQVVGTTPGLVSKLITFDFDIKPRSEGHKALITEVEIEHPWVDSDGDAQFLQGLNLASDLKNWK
ncbi:hypothetical protein ABW20_dc0107504 [Dactylellina cionopaga]|nr:hypothetical protein ABW20_dc0107504 [Dactylellina cionopaga]